jgi:hypothetical protein
LQIRWGLISIDEWKRAVLTQDYELISRLGLLRGYSKGASFGVIFGCSGKKLSVMLKIPEKEGNSKKENFLQQMGLNKVKDFLQTCKRDYPWKGGYYIPLAFDYWVWCSQDHKAINYIIQGTEALAQKLGELRMTALVKKKDWKEEDAFRILSIHDECLWDVREDLAHEMGEIIAQSYTWAAEALYNWYKKTPEKFPNVGGPAFKVDLSGGYDIGDNYGEVH